LTEAARLIGYSDDSITKFERAAELPLAVALACAAIEAELTPIK
jgi:hypothetical protein